MILGTKARYAVMALVDLVKHWDGKPVTLADIAARQEISLAYLEQIFPKLKKAGLVKPVRGPGGGYMLANPPAEIPVLRIIEAVDESLQMTRCSGEHRAKDAMGMGGGCMSDKTRCLTHALWAGLGQQIEGYLNGITLDDVCEKRIAAKSVMEPETQAMPVLAVSA